MLILNLVLAMAEDGGTAKAQLDAVMQGNFVAVTALQPLLADPAAFAAPANAAAIRKDLDLLSKAPLLFARPLHRVSVAPLGSLFGDEVDRARRDFAAGRSDSARLRLRAITGLCMGCHARRLAEHDSPMISTPAVAALKPLERAQYLAATRQFDAALALWVQMMRAPLKTDADRFEQTQVLHSALAVIVRAKDDAPGTVKLLRDQLARTDLAEHTRRGVESMLVDAQTWADEHFDAESASGLTLFERGRTLMQRAGVIQNVSRSEAEEIPLLRAAAYLGLALDRESAAPWRGEALYLLGVVSFSALDPTVWELDGLYLETCVRENPHSALALRCVDRLAEISIVDFTGSGGTRLPPDVASRLELLRGIAKMPNR